MVWFFPLLCLFQGLLLHSNFSTFTAGYFTQDSTAAAADLSQGEFWFITFRSRNHKQTGIDTEASEDSLPLPTRYGSPFQVPRLHFRLNHAFQENSTSQFEKDNFICLFVSFFFAFAFLLSHVGGTLLDNPKMAAKEASFTIFKSFNLTWSVT